MVQKQIVFVCYSLSFFIYGLFATRTEHYVYYYKLRDQMNAMTVPALYYIVLT